MRLGSTRTMRRICLGGTALLLALAAAACGGSSSSTTSGTAPASTGPKAGGSLTVLEWNGYSGDWPAGLDPATNINGAADQSQMNAIYGELFELGPKGAIIPDLATGYSITNDGKTITLDIRPGVTFTDGTPFNAAAVVWNIQRDLKSACTCKPTWPVKSVTATGPYTVTINLVAAGRRVHRPDLRLDRGLDRLADRRAEDGREGVRGQPGRRRPVRGGQRHAQLGARAEEEPRLLADGPPVPGQPHVQDGRQRRGGVRGPARRGGPGLRGHVHPVADSRRRRTSTWRTRTLARRRTTCSSTRGAAVQQRQGPGGHLRGDQLRADPAAHLRQRVPDRPGVHRARRDLLRADVPGYQGYDPTLAKTLVQQSGLGNVTIKLGTIQNPVAAGDHGGAADRVGASGSTPRSPTTRWPR